MASRASRIYRAKVRKVNCRPVATFRPRLEALEDRVVPTFNHGGPIFSHFEAQSVFFGSNWGQSENQTPFNNFGAAGFSGYNGAFGSGSGKWGMTDSRANQTANFGGYNNSASQSWTAHTTGVSSDSYNRGDQRPNGDSHHAAFIEAVITVVVSVANRDVQRRDQFNLRQG